MASEPDYSIRIVLAADETLFPLSKTLPNKNCIRAKKDHIPHHGRCSDLSTPFYNASLRSECSSLAYLKYLHEASLQSAGFSDACRLGVLWLRQRGFRANGGFGPFEWACTIALLMQGGRPKGKPVLSKDYSSYQLFKATLQYLSYSDLIAMPLFIHSSALDFIDHNQPMIFDGVRGMNILYKMTLWSYATLRHEATRSVNLLSDPLSDHFEGCFITNVDQPFQRFDYVMRLSLTEMRRPTSQSEDAIADELKLCFQLYRALNIGLGDRARLVHLQPPPKPPWFSAATEQAAEDRSQVQVGILVDPEQVNRTVDRGPSAEEKEAAVTFRNFWGNKAELRRFKDGSILESLIWSTSDPTKSVLKQIVTHIIQRHVRKNAADEIRFAGDAFDHLLLTQALPSSDTSTLYQPMMDAFDDLEKKIRNLNDFPLQIRQISPADSKLRFASTIVPTLSAERCQMEPADVHIQFEGSSRWPSDIAAVQRTKIAFLLKLGELLLEEPTEVLTAQLGLENLCHRLHNTAFLEVLFSSGALFRLRIHHERELSILERNLIGSTQATASREETAFALSTYKRSFIQASVHTQAVRTLATRFPLLSLCMRLMKRWRDSHLLSNHLSDELIEIVTIRSFAHPYPWSIPGSVMTAFVRTLTFVSKWDWHSEPLIVDFNGEMSSQDIDAIKMRFEAWRKIDPAMNRIAIFAASSIETSGISWTELGPSKVVAARFTSLAKAACNVLKEQSTTIEPRALFLPSMEEYDFVIHFQPNLSNAVDSREKHSAPKNLQTRPNTNVLGVSHDPIHLFVDELVAIYGSHVLFFENKNDRSLIAGLWNPQTGPRPWKVNLQYSTVPFMQSASEDVQISINKDATLHDIARLGGDLISRIEIKP